MCEENYCTPRGSCEEQGPLLYDAFWVKYPVTKDASKVATHEVLSPFRFKVTTNFKYWLVVCIYGVSKKNHSEPILLEIVIEKKARIPTLNWLLEELFDFETLNATFVGEKL